MDSLSVSAREKKMGRNPDTTTQTHELAFLFMFFQIKFLKHNNEW